jgi:hypothetical protein
MKGSGRVTKETVEESNNGRTVLFMKATGRIILLMVMED